MLARRLLLAIPISTAIVSLARSTDAVHSVVDHGARPDGDTLSTSAIQKAIDACSRAGGGTVRFPPGKFLSGALRLASGVTLLVEKDATLLGSRNREDYYGPPVDDDGKPSAGAPVFRHLIHGVGLRNVAIRGQGTIDGSGSAFRDKSKKRTKVIYLERCRGVLVEGVRLRSAGSWMQHYRLCEDVTLRDLDVFNHVAYNNDGLNIDSSKNVTITGCRVDSDDDGIVLKSLSEEPCRNITITNCTVSSHCNALKMGTESGGGFIDITIRDCRVFSPRESTKIYGRQRGLAGIALEIVDGGRMENVSVSNVSIEGVSVPIFLRLGNRARPYGKGDRPGVGTFQNVRLKDIRATGTSSIGCSITGIPGHAIENVQLENISLGSDGGGIRDDAARKVPEKETSYPESTMFGTLPAYGFYCRHARGLKFKNLVLKTKQEDLRHAVVLDDVSDVEFDGLVASFSAGAAPLLRMVEARSVVVRGVEPTGPVDVLLRLEGAATERIELRHCDLEQVRETVVRSAEVPPDAVRVRP